MNKIGRNSSQELVIETSELLIKGNIMCWDETMIQLSNVSCISTRSLSPIAFPVLSIALLIIGFLLFKYNWMLSIVLLVTVIVWICCWFTKNEERKNNTILNIVLNSGNILQIIINDKFFVTKVLHVLEQIIIDGGVGKQDVAINIQGCQITGNASVLNDFNIS